MGNSSRSILVACRASRSRRLLGHRCYSPTGDRSEARIGLHGRLRTDRFRKAFTSVTPATTHHAATPRTYSWEHTLTTSATPFVKAE
jgi:hypothetical protein